MGLIYDLVEFHHDMAACTQAMHSLHLWMHDVHMLCDVVDPNGTRADTCQELLQAII